MQQPPPANKRFLLLNIFNNLLSLRPFTIFAPGHYAPGNPLLCSIIAVANLIFNPNTYVHGIPKDKITKGAVGETESGVYICVDSETMTELTAAHEIGHTLGLVHFVLGLMTPRGDQKERMPLVLPSAVWEIVSKAMNPNERKDDDHSGKGYVIFRSTSENKDQ